MSNLDSSFAPLRTKGNWKSLTMIDLEIRLLTLIVWYHKPTDVECDL